MFEARNVQPLADEAEMRRTVECDGKYSVQIGVDVKAGTEWPVHLILYHADGHYWIETQYFGSHSDGDGEVYTDFDEAYTDFVTYYDAD